MNKPLLVTLLLVAGVTLGIGFAVLAPQGSHRPTIEWLDIPREIKPFTLNSTSEPFTNQSLMGRWTIVLFGFMHCPDICPTSLAELSQVAKNGTVDDTQFVFVSVDPARDSVEGVAAYSNHFHEAIQGLTGNHPQLTKFANDLGIQYKISGESDSYNVAHSITYSIIDPRGKLRGRFRPGFNLEDLNREFATMRAASP